MAKSKKPQPRPKCRFYSQWKTSPPFGASEGVVNAYVQRVFQEKGFDVEVSSRIDSPAEGIPLNSVGAIAGEMRKAVPEIRLFSSICDDVRPVSGNPHGKNILFFHGLRSNLNTYLFRANGFDLYCANSPYLLSVLESLVLYPVDLGRMELINPLGKGPKAIATSIPLCVPLLDETEGYESQGQDLPADVSAALENQGEVFFGHAMRSHKADLFATIAIMHFLNRLGQALSPKRQFKLGVHIGDQHRFYQTAKDLPFEVDISASFIFLPYLTNQALSQLMRKSSFSLCYDLQPESFALYPLESILNGAPVYTNGIGNIRFLLPESHGIDVYESPGMYFGDTKDRFLVYGEVAKRILRDLGCPADVAEKCERGRKYIETNYSFKKFKNQWGRELTRLNNPQAVEVAQRGNLRFEVGPSVRSLDLNTGQVISDFRHVTLTPVQRAAVALVRKKKARDISTRTIAANERVLQELFEAGVLSFRSVKWGQPFRF